MALDPAHWIWMNGRMGQLRDASVPVSAHALHYGSGVFEGIRCYETEAGPAAFRLEDHVDRLFHSAEAYGLEVPHTAREIEDAACEVVRRNRFASCYVRPIVYLGSGSLGIRGRCPVEAAILAWPWPNPLGEDGLRAGVRVTVSPWAKVDPRMVPTTAKGCGQYMSARLAVQEAARRGYDEALLLDSAGRIAEGAVENVFLVRDGVLHTNDERSSILPGITRDSVIQIAHDLGLPVEIGFLRLEDMLSAHEAFFTGTAAEVTPIREVDGARIGDGAPGPITRTLQRTFFAATSGRHPRYARWLRLADGDEVARKSSA
jgi:branched-chain amino acid aminotransferase